MQTTSLDILERTQLPTNQARAILQVMELEIAAREEILATKSELKDAFHLLDLKMEAVRGDIETLRGEVRGEIGALRGEMGALRGELRAEIKGIEGKLTRWVFTCILGQTAVMAGALYFALTHLRQ